MVFSPELALKTSRYPISTLYLPLPYQYRIPMGRGGRRPQGGFGWLKWQDLSRLNVPEPLQVGLETMHKRLSPLL